MQEYSGLIDIDFRVIYSLGGLLIGVFLLLGLYIRKDLRKYVPALILMHLPFGILSEVLFFRDYWYPPAFLELNILGLRITDGDVILSIVAPPVMAFGFITLLRLFPSKNPSKEELRSFAIKLLVAEFINITMYAFLNLAVGINSIYAYSLSSAIIWIFVIWKRRDLFPLAIATAIVIGLSTFIFYYLFQFIVGTGYLHSVWLLGPTTHSLNLLGIEVPLTEVLFGALVAPFYGVLVPYLANFKYKRRVTK